MSNIGSSIKRRKRISFYKKVLYSFIFLLFFISLFILCLTWQKIRIQNVVVTGDTSIDKSTISAIAEIVLADRYMWLIPTDNFLLYHKEKIKSEILNQNKKIDSVHISYVHFPNEIEIRIADRSPEYQWCKDANDCYFMDKDGFIYEKASILMPNPYIEFFGLVKDTAVGQSFFFEKFPAISSFLQNMNEAKLSPVSFTARDENNYEIMLSGGGKIIMNDKDSFDAYLKNINVLIDNGYLKTDSDSLKKLEYIDLRFGNKVPLKFK